MKIQDVMTLKVETSHPETPLAEAAQRMKNREIGFLPITNSTTGALDGVLTDRDICMAALEKQKPLTEILVRDAMTRSVRECAEDMDLQTVHALMRENHIRRLPVTNASGQLVGVISLDDLARAASGKRLGHARVDVAETLGAVGRSHLKF